jgi:HEAT repeat protein
MAENIQALLAKIIDETRPVRSIDLTDLSDLARSEMGSFREAWAVLDDSRRLELVRTLVEQAEANIHLNFHAILRTFLSDPDAQVRRMAIEGLWEDERPNLIAPLVDLLQDDPATEVRAAAATSLGRFMLLGALGEIGDELARVAEEALHMAWYRAGEPVEVRRRALESLAYSSMPELPTLIQNAYFDDDELMRQSALFAMGRSADRRWARLVLAELGSPEPAMRFEAAIAAGEMALREAVQTLIRRLDDPDAGVRDAAIAALGKIGGPLAKRALQALAKGSDEVLAQAAEDALDELNFGGERLDDVLGDEGRARPSDDEEDEEADLADDELADEELDAEALYAEDEFGDFEDDDLFDEEDDGLDSDDDEDDWDDDDLAEADEDDEDWN